MESLMIAGIAGLAGYYLQDKSSRRTDSYTDTEIQSMPETEKPNSINMYSGNKVDAANDDLLQRSLINYKNAETPSSSGVLPPIYNSYSAIGNERLLQNNLPEQKLSDVNDINRRADVFETKQPILGDRPMFKLSQLGTPSDDSFANFGSGLSIGQEVSLLSGQTIQREHSNMVPFFGSNVKQNVEHFTNESKLDNYTGLKSTFVHKQAPLPRFEQMPESIFGAPLLTDHIDTSRFVPSAFRQNEKPFYEQKISAPIAGTLENPLNSVKQPTIDSLRTVNKQQVTYEGRTKAGQMGSVRAATSNVMKNRPDTHFQLGTERMFKSTGAFIATQQPDNYQNLQQTSRQNQNIEYFGSAKHTESLAAGPRLKGLDNTNQLDFASLVQVPKRNQLHTDTQRNIGSTTSGVNDYGKNSIQLSEPERATTHTSHTLNINKSASGHQVTLQDEVKGTLKETLLGKLDNTGNIRTNTVNRDKNYGVTDYTVKPTQKETLVHNRYKGQANKKDGMGYTVVKPHAKTTHKELTSDVYYSGHANDNNKNGMVYSTFANPEKVRNAVHVENYKGTGSYHTSASQNRQQYANAEITAKKEVLLQGQRPSGRKSTLGSISNNTLGETKLTANMLLKEKTKTRHENIHTQNVIPSKSSLGQQQQPHNRFSEIENSRININDVSAQLRNNPFYNLK